ncbi:MAG: Ig-like domain-containing protein [Planctomycetes bacterium]|nr:Ig-like domain-containing protein [Planctomycetota bacterium]
MANPVRILLILVFISSCFRDDPNPVKQDPEPAPTILAVVPNRGSRQGGESITISGTSFKDGISIFVGAAAASDVVVTTSNSLRFTLPASSSEGPVDVRLVTVDGREVVSAGAFTYLGDIFIGGATGSGPVTGGKVNVYELSASGDAVVPAIATATTDSLGQFSVNIGSSTKPFFIEVVEGSYIDEATGAQVAITKTNALKLVFPGTIVSTGNFSVTPLTTIAATIFQTDAASGSISDPEVAAMNSNGLVNELFGVEDVTRTGVFSFRSDAQQIAIAQEAAAQYHSLILSGLAQLASQLGVSRNALIVAIAADIGKDRLADGLNAGEAILLGTTSTPLPADAIRQSLANAMTNFVGGAPNMSGFSIGQMQPHIDALLALGTLAETPPSIASVFPSSGNQSGSIACKITGSGFGSAPDVYFGEAKATITSVIENIQTGFIEANVKTPAGKHGPVDVTVVNTSNSLAGFLANGYSYFDTLQLTDPPVVQVTSPEGGKFPGGASITLTWNTISSRRDRVRIYFRQGLTSPETFVSEEVDTGTFALTVPLLDGSDFFVRIEAIDLAGLTGSDSNDAPFTLDSTAPEAPSIGLADASDTGTKGDGITNSASPTFVGAAVGSASVNVLDSNSEVLFTATTTNDVFTLENVALSEGSFTWFLQGEDEVGNVSAVSSAFTFTVDTTAPAAPTPIVLAASSDSGSSSSDGITNVTLPVVDVTVTEGHTIEILKDQALKAQALIGTIEGASKTVSVTLSSDLAEGSNVLTVRVRDAAWNVSTENPTLTVVLDSTAPVAPSGIALLAAHDTGSSSADLVTNLLTFDVVISASEGDTAELFEGETSSGTGAISSGTATINFTASTAGSFSFTAYAEDVAGNTSESSAAFDVTVDNTAPSASVTVTIEAGNIPDVISIAWNEAVDGASVTGISSYAFENPTGSSVSISGATVSHSATTNITKITLPTSITLQNNGFSLDHTGATDIAGNVAGLQTFTGNVSGDFTKPEVSIALPTDNGNMNANQSFIVRFSESMDPSTFTYGTTSSSHILLLSGGSAIAGTFSLLESDTLLVVDPGQTLTVGVTYTLALMAALTDVAGNALVAPDTVTGVGSAKFIVATVTGTDSSQPTVTGTTPVNSATDVRIDQTLSVTFSEAIDPASMSSATVSLKRGTTDVPYTSAWADDFKSVSLTTASNMLSGTSYTLQVTSGVKDTSGNAVTNPQTINFQTSNTDITAPTIDGITLNGISSKLNGAGSAGGTLLVPRDGFSIDVSFADLGGSGLDTSTLQITSNVPTGEGSGSGGFDAGSNLVSLFTVSSGSATFTVTNAQKFPVGMVTISASVSDLAGNASTEVQYTFEATEATDTLTALENTNIWYLDFDRDVATISISEGSGSNVNFSSTAAQNSKFDFDEDLQILGLNVASGAPTVTGSTKNTNEVMRDKVIDSVLENLYGFYGITYNGGNISTNSDSIDISFVTTLPSGTAWQQNQTQLSMSAIGYSRISIGGFTAPGSIGFAWYDEQNQLQDNDSIAPLTDPGVSSIVGVFPSTLFDSDINSSSTGTFRSTFDAFIPLSNRGNAPVGSQPEDADVLSESFNYHTATSAQQDRYAEIQTAIDVLGRAVAYVVAHEVGHSLGLVADGAPPVGLHGGDSTNFSGSTSHHITSTGEFPTGATNVMAPSSFTSESTNSASGFSSLIKAYLRGRLFYRP